MKQINGLESSAVSGAQLAGMGRDSSTSTTKTYLQVTRNAVAVKDSTQLSTTSMIVQQSGSLADVRLDKVLPIKAAIDAGTYRVSASTVADRILQVMAG